MFHMPMSSPQRIRMFGCFVAIFSLLLVEIDCLCRASDKTRIHRFFEACNPIHARLGPPNDGGLGLISLFIPAHFRQLGGGEAFHVSYLARHIGGSPIYKKNLKKRENNYFRVVKG